MLLLQNSNLQAFDFFQNVNELYGVDFDETGVTPDSSIQIPQSTLNINARQLTLVQHVVNPLGASDEYGIDLYEQTLEIITSDVNLNCSCIDIMMKQSKQSWYAQAK